MTVYCLAIYSTFLSNIVSRLVYMCLSALAHAGVGYAAVSSWTLFGTGIRSLLTKPKFKQGVNIALALLLVYTVIDLSGIVHKLFA